MIQQIGFIINSKPYKLEKVSGYFSKKKKKKKTLTITKYIKIEIKFLCNFTSIHKQIRSSIKNFVYTPLVIIQTANPDAL